MARITGTNQDDEIATDGVSIDVHGGPATASPDLIRARGGDDIARAGAGDDTVSGGSGDDLLMGEAGGDLLSGANGGDSLSGGDGADTLLGGRDDDAVRGDAGDDLLDGGPGLDVAIYAGARSSYAVEVAQDGSVTVRGLNGTTDGVDEGTDTLLGIEALRFLGGGANPNTS